MRLIDADALVEQVCLDGDCTQCKTGVNEKVCKWNMFQLKDVIDCLEHAPTVDAVPVVRCEDCKYGDWYTVMNRKRLCYCTEHGSSGHNENDYCSYGEREDDD